MVKFILRKDNKFHTEYKFSSRLSGWDGMDANDAPSQIHTIDGLFKNVIAHLRNLEIIFRNMDIVVKRVPAKVPASKQLIKLSGELKHDIQGLKNEAVAAWKASVSDVKIAAKLAKQARGDSAVVPRKDNETESSKLKDEAMWELLEDVHREARALVKTTVSVRKLVVDSLTRRLKNKKVTSSTAKPHIDKIVKACDEIYKIGDKIWDLAEAAKKDYW